MPENDLISLTRGECIAIALALQFRTKSASPEIEAALSSAEIKLSPLLADVWNKAFDALLPAG